MAEGRRERTHAWRFCLSEVRESMKGHLRLRLRSKGSPLLREVVISSWEKGSFRITFSSRAITQQWTLTESGREWVPIPYGNRTRVFDMKRRCPNHWTKGTKKPFFIYLSSENRSGSFSFYTQFKISFVFMLAISDVNSAGRPPFLRVPPPTQWHTNHAPSLSPIIKPPDPFICLSSPLNK